MKLNQPLSFGWCQSLDDLLLYRSTTHISRRTPDQEGQEFTQNVGMNRAQQMKACPMEGRKTHSHSRHYHVVLLCSVLTCRTQVTEAENPSVNCLAETG